jgi:hypothetical protein
LLICGFNTHIYFSCVTTVVKRCVTYLNPL